MAPRIALDLDAEEHVVGIEVEDASKHKSSRPYARVCRDAVRVSSSLI